jgi:hypothetical protein
MQELQRRPVGPGYQTTAFVHDQYVLIRVLKEYFSCQRFAARRVFDRKQSLCAGVEGECAFVCRTDPNSASGVLAYRNSRIWQFQKTIPPVRAVGKNR